MAKEGERIVMIAMDGSSYCNYAFDYYLKNIKHDNDFLVLFNCVEYHQLTANPMGVGNAELINSMIEDENEKAKAYLDILTAKMKDNQLHGKIKQVHGSPRIELIRVAEEEKASLIITGTRGMGQVRRTFLGSVSDHVMHHSHVPVLICRHKDDHHHVHGHHHGRSHGTEKMVMP